MPAEWPAALTNNVTALSKTPPLHLGDLPDHETGRIFLKPVQQIGTQEEIHEEAKLLAIEVHIHAWRVFTTVMSHCISVRYFSHTDNTVFLLR